MSLDLGKSETRVLVSDDGISLSPPPSLSSFSASFEPPIIVTWEELEEIVTASNAGQVSGQRAVLFI